jgi:predicted RNA-binding Zn-ribbon protein involved in translation (DUF1610 family)
MPKPRERKCRSCGARYRPVQSFQAWCSPECGLELARARQGREKAKEVSGRRLALKTRSDWLREAQAAFNGYIRARDRGKPCICCGGTGNGWSRGGEWDAGHYRSVGSAPHLRFDERNCHAQLKRCNRYGFDPVGYRAGLISRIGLAAVEALERDQEPRRYTVENLREIAKEYRRRTRNISKGGVT